MVPASTLLTHHAVTSVAHLRALIGEPAELTVAKISDRLNSVTRLFIERSPFVCVATSDAAGHCDAQRFVDPATMPTVMTPNGPIATTAGSVSIEPGAGSTGMTLPGSNSAFVVKISPRNYLFGTASDRMNDETQHGWVKPQRARSAIELQQLIESREAELRALKNELFNLENGARLEAVAQIRNIMRAQQLTLSDIAGG